jgi:hypothetical protein
MENDSPEVLKAAHKLVIDGDYEQAIPLLDVLMDRDPNDPAVLNLMGYVAMQSGNDNLGYQLLKRAVDEAPEQSQVWTNFGLAAQHLDRLEESLESCLKAVSLNPGYALAWTNTASTLIAMSRWDEALKAAKTALDINPNDWRAKCNLAHCHLAKHEWVEGWKYWELSLGSDQRKEWAYGNETRWDGSKNKAVVIYGEQGLGDEIFFASCVPDAIGDCKKVIIDCDPRLEGLFRRSFPRADVHGTRRSGTPEWLNNARIDARCSVGSLPQFYRTTDAAFPGKAYLKADPEKVLMWKSLWQSKGKKVIGICSEGGAKYTNKRGRKIPLEAWESLLSQDAIFVSLDYRDGIEHPKLRHYPQATKSSDYDDTAALIASLDCVVGVNTTAVHCANGLGIPTHVLVPTNHQWRYAGDYLWSDSAKIYRQNGREWAEVLKEVKA